MVLRKLLLALLSGQVFVNAAQYLDYETDTQGRRTCTVKAIGSRQDDVPHIMEAFQRCGRNGRVIFPEDQEYWIASRLNPTFDGVEIEWRGQWTYSDDLNYWRNNSYPIFYQNHHAGFVITGHHIQINGYGTGGIHGNGNKWYTAEHGDTKPGRPMPFVFWNISDVTVKSFFVKQPQLWSLNIINGTDMRFDDIYNNATAYDAPKSVNWVQNTDGFDTMDSKNIVLTNFVYQGGDDCIAIKDRSYNIFAQNLTCNGGGGIAIGSLGEYLTDASVQNVHVKNVVINKGTQGTNGPLAIENGAYIKTWIGHKLPQDSYEAAGKPRGGGHGAVRNIVFENFRVNGPGYATLVDQDYGDTNETYPGTSKLSVGNIEFVDFKGYTDPEDGGSKVTDVLSCSRKHRCFGIQYRGHKVVSQKARGVKGQLGCRWVDSVQGKKCHPESAVP